MKSLSPEQLATAQMSNDLNNQELDDPVVERDIIIYELRKKLEIAIEALEYIDSTACKTDSRAAYEALRKLK